MRILLIATVWRSRTSNRWLLDDLADELVRTGHEVDVLVADPRASRPPGLIESEGGLRVWNLGPVRRRPGLLGSLTAHAVTAWRLRTTARRLLGREERYDLGVYTSVGTFNWSLPRWARSRGVVRRLVFVLWDFFPVHQMQIGRLRSSLAASVLKRLERRAIGPADVVALMSEANVRFYREYFPALKAQTTIIRPWSAAPIAERKLSDDRVRVVFGGQLTAGRDLVTLVDAARLGHQRQLPVTLVIAGGGPALDAVRADAADLGNVEVVGALPRDAYRALVATCDAGIAITVAGTTVPSFPSKIVEYCAAGIGVIVATESTSDAGEIIEAAGAGIAIQNGSAAALADAFSELVARKRSGQLASMGHSARELFDTELSVERAAERLLSQS